MALWGGEQAEENHPEQAVRAALEMQAAFGSLTRGTRLADLGPEDRDQHGSGRDESDRQYRRVHCDRGHRQHCCAAGRRSADRCPARRARRLRHVRGVFSVRTQEPLTVKGKRTALRTYLVEAVQPRAFRLPNRGVEGVETAMVGRQHELAKIQNALEEAKTTSTSRTVTIFGEAGIGKSRLLFEFEDWLRLQPMDVRLFKGRAEQRHEHVRSFASSATCSSSDSRSRRTTRRRRPPRS